MNHIGTRFPEHGLHVVEHCRNPVSLLDDTSSVQIDIANCNGLNELGNRLQSRAVTFRYVAGAKQRDAESAGWSYLT